MILAGAPARQWLADQAARTRALTVRQVVVAAVVVWCASALFYGLFGARWYLDLDIYRAAGASLYHGGQPFHERFMAAQLPFTYPPFALLVLSPLSLLPVRLAQVLWWAMSCAALVAVIARLMVAARRTGVDRSRLDAYDPGAGAVHPGGPVAGAVQPRGPVAGAPQVAGPRTDAAQPRGPRADAAQGAGWGPFTVIGSRATLWAWAALIGALSTLVLEPVRSNLAYGQINLLLMLLVVVDCTCAKQTWWHGCLVGLAGAVKLTPLVFLIAFLMSRDWRSLARGVATFAGATAVSWLVMPSASSAYWLHQVANARRTGPLGQIRNQSWYGMLHRAPFHWGHGATIGWALLVVATMSCGAWLAYVLARRGRQVELVMALGLTELLVSPVSWTHHWSWVVVAAIAAPLLWGHRRGVARLLVALLVLIVLAPYWWLPLGPLTPVSRNLLVLAGAAVLGWWSAVEWAAWRRSRWRGTGAVAAEAGALQPPGTGAVPTTTISMARYRPSWPAGRPVGTWP